jgi:hypothetical protein
LRVLLQIHLERSAMTNVHARTLRFSPPIVKHLGAYKNERAFKRRGDQDSEIPVEETLDVAGDLRPVTGVNPGWRR